MQDRNERRQGRGIQNLEKFVVKCVCARCLHTCIPMYVGVGVCACVCEEEVDIF